MKIYMVVTPDNEMKIWRQRLGKPFPKTNAFGIVHLEGLPYVVDDSKCLRSYVRPAKYFGLIKKERRYYYWRQNEPAPVEFDLRLTPGSMGTTSDTIKQYVSSKHLAMLVSTEFPWLMVAFIGLLLLVMGVAVGYSYGITAGGR